MLVAAPLLGAMLAEVLGVFGQWLPDNSMLGQTFTAVGEYWLLIAILSLVVNVGASATSIGGGFGG